MIKLAEIRDICRIKKVMCMILLFSLIFIGHNPVFQEEMQKTENVQENLLISPLTAGDHSPILIDGDAELAGFCADNYTYGSSWADAHVIKDYEIDAGASGSAIEIRNTTLYLIIQNCTVTNSMGGGYESGIYLNNCTNVKITGCNSSFNDNYGFTLLDSHDCIIAGNNATNNLIFGIYLKSSHSNTLSKNNASDNDEGGIYLEDNCDNNTISGNNASYNTYGIYLYTNCDNNTISGNNASYNTYEGIFLLEGNNNTISGNNVSDNNNGIYLFSSSNNTLSGNNASRNTHLGIILEGCNNSIILGNIASYNSDSGICLYIDCYNNTISGNNASDNNMGIYLDEYCYNNTISGNNVSDNNNGIYLFSSSNNTLSENNVSYNTDSGIYLYEFCDKNIISGNNASYNTDCGIYLEDNCDNNTISGNIACHNTYCGISLDDNCDNNTISGNNASDNVLGIYLNGNSDNNTISGNNASYNIYGILLDTYCDNNTISGNNASYNLEIGIYLSWDNDDNTIWMNYISNNSYSQGFSGEPTNWDNGTLGNYWGDFEERYPDATSSNGIWWDCEYQVNTTIYNDTRPLVHPGFPEIDSSANVDYMIGDEGNEISWTISDSTILDPTFWIYLDGVEIQTGSWNSGSIFSINVDGYSVGTYNYVLKCNDGTAWGWSEGQIAVNVAEIPKPVLITASQTISTKNITVDWSEVTGIDSYKVYVNGIFTNSTNTLEQIIWLNQNGTYLITITAINGAEESEHSDSIMIIVLLNPPDDEGEDINIGVLIGSIGGSVFVVGVGAFLFIKKRRVPK